MREGVKELRRMSYPQYLLSDWWGNKRRMALALQDKCQRCGFKDQLDVHHLTYENLGDEKDEDLIVLCRRCHNDLHYFADHESISAREAMQIEDVTEEEYKEKQELFKKVPF